MSLPILIQELNGTPVVESTIVAEGLGITHKALLQTLTKHLSTIESKFGQVAFEMRPGYNNAQTRVAHLTESQFAFIGSLSRNTSQVVEFKATLVEKFQQAKKVQAITPASSDQIILMLAQRNVETSLRLTAIESNLAEVNARLTTHASDFYAIAGYAALVKQPIDITIASQLGRKATTISKTLGFHMGVTHDPRFGTVKTYHKDVLETVFNDFFTKQAA